jgi:hypothetical protein
MYVSDRANFSIRVAGHLKVLDVILRQVMVDICPGIVT